MFLNPGGWLEAAYSDIHHTHPNKETIDKISEDASGNLVFNNEQIDISPKWESFDI